MSTSPQTARPRRSGTGARLALAAVVAATGLTASIAWAAVGLSDQTRRPAAMATTTTPGSVTVEIDRPGAHVVYLESAVPTATRGLDPVLGLAAADLAVTDAEGVPVEVDTYPRDLRYDVRRSGSVSVGQAVAVFEAAEPGPYTVSTTTRLADRSARIAVGDDLVPGVLRAVLLPALSAAVALALAAVIVLRAGLVADRHGRTSTRTGGAR
ncbi:hypothetical protein [Actinotalea sp.]|uniref:hypothetical protein n=1 Tax=Actinotalea sp. TaxID=1872145 RepID=UPI003568CD09